MATIDKKLIHFEKLSDFEARLAAGDIRNRSIVWIKDAKKIWTHGEYYAGNESDLSAYLTSEEIAEIYAAKSSLAAVATSGSYGDLSGKPSIPEAVTEETVGGWGFTKNTGTVTGITMNGTNMGSSGSVDLGTVITAHQDISGKQDKLVSGTSIKTINGTSLLGSGNIGMIWATATNGVDYPSVTIN